MIHWNDIAQGYHDERRFVDGDNANIYHEAQRIAEERNGDVNARYRVRIHFENMLRLAHADRPLAKRWPPVQSHRN